MKKTVQFVELASSLEITKGTSRNGNPTAIIRHAVEKKQSLSRLAGIEMSNQLNTFKNTAGSSNSTIRTITKAVDRINTMTFEELKKELESAAWAISYTYVYDGRSWQVVDRALVKLTESYMIPDTILDGEAGEIALRKAAPFLRNTNNNQRQPLPPKTDTSTQQEELKPKSNPIANAIN